MTSFEEIESERVDSLEAEIAVKTKQIQSLNEQLSCARNTIHGLESTINTMQINQSELKDLIRSLKAENESLKKNFEKLKSKVLENGDVATVNDLAEAAGDEEERITVPTTPTENKSTSPEINASSAEENTDSYEHIGSGNDLTDDEADSDEFTEGKPSPCSASLPPTDECDDVVVSR